MRHVAVVLMMFVFSLGFGQISENDKMNDSLNDHGMPYFKLLDPVGYLLDKQEFTFTPGKEVIFIKRLQDEQEVDYGKLRRTTPDGLYIMTTTINEEVSFGRFDSIGNFRTLRYNEETDSVMEELYRRRLAEKGNR
jgi:hypothetical protein